MKRGYMIITVIMLIFALCFNASTVSVKADDIESVYNTEDDTEITLVDDTEDNDNNEETPIDDNEETIIEETDANEETTIEETDTNEETEVEQLMLTKSTLLKNNSVNLVSVTVPTSISIAVDSEGNVTCAESNVAQIVNNGGSDIEITSTVLELNEGWSLEDWNTNFCSLQVNQKLFSMQLMGVSVDPQTGEFGISDFVVEAGSSLNLTYDGKIPAQTEGIDAVIGELVFTVSAVSEG